MTITEFLFARIAEDEAAARASIATQAPDEWDNPTSVGNYYPADIAFWDRVTPSRVLSECASKRAIVDAHPIVNDVVEVSTRIKWGFACETCFSYGDIVEDHGYCDTLRALAAVYSDHPDYRQEWAL